MMNIVIQDICRLPFSLTQKRFICHFFYALLFISAFCPQLFSSYLPKIKQEIVHQEGKTNPDEKACATVPKVLSTNIPSSFYKVTNQATYIEPLQSCAKKLFIEAQGDVYISGIIATGDLVIYTTGHVYLQDDLIVNGAVTVRARAVMVLAHCRAESSIQILAETSVGIKGSMSSKKNIQLVGAGDITIDGMMKASEGVVVLAGGILNQGGTVTSEQDIVMTVKGYKQSGNCVSTLKTVIVSEGDIKFAPWSMTGAQQVVITSKRGSVDVEGDVYGSEGIQVTSEAIAVSGKLHSNGPVVAAAKNLTITGSLIGTCGIDLSIEKALSIGGICKAYGPGLRGTVGQLDNKGDLETRGVSLSIETGNNYGSMRTLGHFSLKGNKYFNHKGSFTFTAGVHHVDCADSYADAGALYTPTLFLAHAHHLMFLTGHHGYLKDGLLSASRQITVEEGAYFDLSGPRVFLQFSSDGSVTFRGVALHDSKAHFPVLAYYESLTPAGAGQKRISAATSVSLDETGFRKEIDKIAQNHPLAKLDKGSGITITVQGDVKYAGTSKLDGGALTVDAGGAVHAEQGTMQAGYFTGNSVSIHATQVALKETSINTYFDNVLLVAQGPLSLKDATLSSGMSSILKALSCDIKNSTIESEQSTEIAVKKAVLVKSSQLRSAAQTLIQGNDLDVHGSAITSKLTALSAENVLRMYDDLVISERTLLSGSTVEGRKLTLESDA